VAVFKDYVDEALAGLPRTSLFEGHQTPLEQARWHGPAGPPEPEGTRPVRHWREGAV
jgi:hypothetical protein